MVWTFKYRRSCTSLLVRENDGWGASCGREVMRSRRSYDIFCCEANRTYRDLDAANKGKEGIQMTPGFCPGIPFTEMGKDVGREVLVM